MRNTQSNSSNITKIVLYYGKEFEVPTGHVYIHTDSSGAVYTSTLECDKSKTTWLLVRGRGSKGAKVGSFNHTEMSTINWMQSQKRIQDLKVPCYPVAELIPELEPTGHPYADWMLKYAQIAQYSDKPWKEFEWFCGGKWVDCSGCTIFSKHLQYRLKPQQVQIQVGQVWESSKTKVKFSVVSTDVCHNTDNLCIELNHTLDVGLDIPYTVTEDTLRKHFQLVK